MIKQVGLLHIPSIIRFFDSATYFEHLLALNLEKNPSLSGRKISKTLNWPPSLMVDIIKKRKPLTPQRASEFARQAEFSALELERLIWISLMETGDKQTHDYFRGKLALDPNLVLEFSQPLFDHTMYYYVDMVVAILLLEKRLMKAEEIAEKINRKNISIAKIQQAMDFVLQKEVLVWNESKACFDQNKRFHYDNNSVQDKQSFQGIEIHQDYAKSFLDFTENPVSPSTYISGCITITKDQFMPIALQLFQIRNWLLHLSEQNRRTVDLHNPRVMQLDLNFFRITK